MSRSEQVYTLGLKKGLFSEGVLDYTVIPLSVRKALGDEFYKIDPTKLDKEDHKQYLVDFKDIVTKSSAKAEWSQWMRLPHMQGEKQLRKAHSQATLFEVFRQTYKQEQHLLNEQSLSEMQQQESHTTLVREDHSALSEEGEVQPQTPDQDLNSQPALSNIVYSIPSATLGSLAPPAAPTSSVSAKKVEALLQQVDTTVRPRGLTTSEVLDLITRRVAELSKRK